jgi:hypothetical protein
MLIKKGLDTALDGAEDEGTTAVFPSGMFKEVKLPID